MNWKAKSLTLRSSLYRGGGAAGGRFRVRDLLNIRGRACLGALAAACCRETYMVEGSGIGDFGGGSLEPPRRWLGSQWLGLALGVQSCPEPPGAL
eukprot:scaffold7495_cov53-Phaeocystis_antarctica.AAC.2